MFKHSLFLSIIVTMISAPTSASDFTKFLKKEAYETQSILSDKLHTNSYTISEKLEKCLDRENSSAKKDSSYNKSCLEKISKEIAVEKTKNWKAMRNLFAASAATHLVASLAKDASLKNTGSAINGISSLSDLTVIGLGADQFFLYDLESKIEDAKKS